MHAGLVSTSGSWSHSALSQTQRFYHWIIAADVVPPPPVLDAPKPAPPNRLWLGCKHMAQDFFDRKIGEAFEVTPLPRECDVDLPPKKIGRFDRPFAIAQRVALCVMIILLASAVAYGIGTSIHYVGFTLKKICFEEVSDWARPTALTSAFLMQAGKGVARIAHTISSIFTTPIYGIVYAGPKWVCSKAISFLCSGACSAVNLGASGASWIATKPQPLLIAIGIQLSSLHTWTKATVFRPTLNFLTHSIFLPAMAILHKASSAIYADGCLTASWIGAHILSPVWSIVGPIFSSLLTPPIQGMSTILNHSLSNLKAMFNLFWDKVFGPVSGAAYHFLAYVLTDLRPPAILLPTETTLTGLTATISLRCLT